MSASRTTTDHDEIKHWVESRDGHPATVDDGDDVSVLRIDFGESEDGLRRIEWDEFFEKFEEKKLAFLHQDTTDGGEEESRFNKFVSRD